MIDQYTEDFAKLLRDYSRETGNEAPTTSSMYIVDNVISFQDILGYPVLFGNHRTLCFLTEGNYNHHSKLITMFEQTNQAAPPKPTGSAFELVDCTDDEKYFPLGHWLALADAIAALDECKDPDDLGSDGCHDDYCKVEIREHKIGWSGHGKKVYQREWSQKYDEAKDEYDWHVVMPNNGGGKITNRSQHDPNL